MSPLRSASLVSRVAAVLFVILLVVVVWGSLIRLQSGPPGNLDKVQHFAAYAGLTLLGFTALGRRSWPLLLGVVALGAGVEVLQTMLPTGRMGSALDGLANTVGALSALAAWTAAKRIRRPG